MIRCYRLPVADPGFGKGNFMRMCTVATTPPFDAHAHIDATKVAAAVLIISCSQTLSSNARLLFNRLYNYRETVQSVC